MEQNGCLEIQVSSLQADKNELQSSLSQLTKRLKAKNLRITSLKTQHEELKSAFEAERLSLLSKVADAERDAETSHIELPALHEANTSADDSNQWNQDVTRRQSDEVADLQAQNDDLSANHQYALERLANAEQEASELEKELHSQLRDARTSGRKMKEANRALQEQLTQAGTLGQLVDQRQSITSQLQHMSTHDEPTARGPPTSATLPQVSSAPSASISSHHGVKLSLVIYSLPYKSYYLSLSFLD